jgi:hypothetical protein
MTTETQLTVQQIQDILHQVQFMDYKWQVHSSFLPSLNVYLQASFQTRCARTGVLTDQKSRKWLISQHMTKSEIVQTAFKCALTSMEHEAREHFTYQGQPIFGPHFNVDHLVGLCQTDS